MADCNPDTGSGCGNLTCRDLPPPTTGPCAELGLSSCECLEQYGYMSTNQSASGPGSTGEGSESEGAGGTTGGTGGTGGNMGSVSNAGSTLAGAGLVPGGFNSEQFKSGNFSNPNHNTGMFSPQTGAFQASGAPQYQGFGFQGTGAVPGFQGVAGAAQGGVINSFDTAANRLRERLDAQASSQAQGAVDAAGARGFGNSGFAERQRFDAQQGARSAYAQGLNQLSNQFEQNRLQGLGIANNALQGIQAEGFLRNNLGFQNQQGLNAFNQGNHQFLNTLGQQNSQFGAEQLNSLFGQASAQELEAMLAAAKMKSEEELGEYVANSGGTLSTG